MNKNFETIISRLKDSGQKMIPLSEKDINGIEKEVNMKLPEVYRTFLSLMGRGAGDFMKGSSVFYNDFDDFKYGVTDIIEENKLPKLPENAFVFWMHQGYQFAFFLLSDGGDPPVYYFSEGRNQLDYQQIETLSEFFLIELEMSGL